jgi:sugar lactone lactonase YvrE
MGITIDSNKNIYVSTSNDDFENLNVNSISQVRKITPSGYVTNEIASGLYNSVGITVNNSGEVFIVDSWNQRILKKTIGSLDVFAGVYSISTIKVFDGIGYPPMAHFNNLKGVATDSSGNIYVVDRGNFRIRKITPSGNVSTLAGSTSGFNNGIASQALFCDPIGITIDNSDNIYIIENYNCDPNHSMAGIEVYGIIRKITPNGIVSSYPPNNPDLNLYNVKGGIVIDQNSNIYVTYNNRIRKVTPNGVFSDFAGTWDSGYINGQGVAAKFNNPTGLAIDPSGNIYVADTGNSRIRKITPSGVVSTLAVNSNITFNDIVGIAYVAGNLYVTKKNYTGSKGELIKITPIEEVFSLCYFCGGIDISINKNNIFMTLGCQVIGLNDQTILNSNQNSFVYPTINLFPNPVKNTLYLKSMSPLTNENFVLYDSVGKILSKGTITNENYGINVEFLSTGIYFIKLGANSAIKFIKE